MKNSKEGEGGQSGTNPLKTLLKRIINLSTTKQAALTIMTAAASAAVLYGFYPLSIVLYILLVVIAHELGHWSRGGRVTKVSLPLIVPLGPIVVGMTPMYPTSDYEEMTFIYEGGPRWGMMAAAFLVALYTIFPSYFLLLTALSLSLNELYSITFGSDGRRIKKMRRLMRKERNNWKKNR